MMNKTTKLNACPVCAHPVLFKEDSSQWECTFCKTAGVGVAYQGTLPEFTANMKAMVEEASGVVASHIPNSIKTAMGMADAMASRWTEEGLSKFKSTYAKMVNETQDDPSIGPKYDTGKLQYGLIPPIATRSLAQVLTFGAAKYAPNSWQKVPDGERRYTDALYRHMEAYRMGEPIDSESKLSHLAHAITNIAFLLHFEEQRNKKEQ